MAIEFGIRALRRQRNFASARAGGRNGYVHGSLFSYQFILVEIARALHLGNSFHGERHQHHGKESAHQGENDGEKDIFGIDLQDEQTYPAADGEEGRNAFQREQGDAQIPVGRIELTVAAEIGIRIRVRASPEGKKHHHDLNDEKRCPDNRYIEINFFGRRQRIIPIHNKTLLLPLFACKPKPNVKPLTFLRFEVPFLRPFSRRSFFRPFFPFLYSLAKE